MTDSRRPGTVPAAAAAVAITVAACAGPAGQSVDATATTSVRAGQGLPRTAPPCSAAGGSAEHVTFPGSSQGQRGDYRVYLPPCYQDNPLQAYPAIYLLHGAGADDTFWQQVGVEDAANAAIARGDIPPMILIAPDGGPVYGAGRGGVTFDTFLVEELVARIDTTYRTVHSRAGRAVGGISLGGGHALAIAAHSPALFTAAGGHSPAVGDLDAIARGLTDGGVRVWLDVGEGDSLRSGAIELAADMRAVNGQVEIHVPEGGHEREYWRSHLGEYLAFYAGAFITAP